LASKTRIGGTVPLKIVYIDDEAGLCQAFVDNFANHMIEVATFTDPEKGVEEITQRGADFVFLDYRLPNTNGKEIAAKIPANIPIALISGDLSPEVHSRFSRVFGKPFDFIEIEALLLELLRKKGTP